MRYFVVYYTFTLPDKSNGAGRAFIEMDKMFSFSVVEEALTERHGFSHCCISGFNEMNEEDYNISIKKQ